MHGTLKDSEKIKYEITSFQNLIFQPNIKYFKELVALILPRWRIVFIETIGRKIDFMVTTPLN